MGELYDPEVREPLTGAAPDSIEGLLFPSGAWASQRTTSNTFPQFSLTHSHASAWSGASSAAAPPQHYRARQQASEPGARGGSGGGAGASPSHLQSGYQGGYEIGTQGPQ